jgi:hypothetical protein
MEYLCFIVSLSFSRWVTLEALDWLPSITSFRAVFYEEGFFELFPRNVLVQIQ